MSTTDRCWKLPLWLDPIYYGENACAIINVRKGGNSPQIEKLLAEHERRLEANATKRVIAIGETPNHPPLDLFQ